jgi:hypothetical protein
MADISKIEEPSSEEIKEFLERIGIGALASLHPDVIKVRDWLRKKAQCPS